VPIKVFISYAHESAEHLSRALDLAQQLRLDGIESSIDQFVSGSPPEGWPQWMESQIQWADFVLVVGSPGYLLRYSGKEVPGKGLGVIWEAGVVRFELYSAGMKNSKFVPVLFDGDEPISVPLPLRAHTHYRLSADYERLLRALTNQPSIIPNPIRAARVLEPVRGAQPDITDAFTQHHVSVSALRRHKRLLAARAAKHDWWSRPISLQLSSGPKDETTDARDALKKWIADSASQHCVILGDPGAGKTGLVWWVAWTLTSVDAVLPLVVPAARLRNLDRISLPDIVAVAEPRPEAAIEPETLKNCQIVLLLDGLDELVGVEVGGDRIAADLISKVLLAIPSSSRVLAACRTPAFGLIEHSFRASLPKHVAHEDGDDAYDIVISRALGLENGTTAVFRIQQVQSMEAQSFLENSNLSKPLIHTATTSRGIAPFLTAPFSLRLLKLALPHLDARNAVAVHELYRTYIATALSRADQTLSKDDLTRVVGDFCRYSRDRRFQIPDRSMRLGIASGIFMPNSKPWEFSHYSLWEYFFANGVFEQITKYDSSMLSRLDLVSGYNINRMLAPMMVHLMNERAGEGTPPPLAVTSTDYRRFLDATGWRATMGYGIHPSMTYSRDGTPSATLSVDREVALATQSSARHGDKVACALSWYDCAVFALFSGVRLPRSVEMLGFVFDGDYLFWCSDWCNEDISHIAVFDTKTRRVHGINPDVRLPRTALAVVGNVK
jgi:hypothetical protein